MASKRRSPLDPGAYGKPQRWHEILMDGAKARADKRDAQRRSSDEAANTIALLAAASIITILD